MICLSVYLVEGDVSGVRRQAGRGVATLARSVMCAALVVAAWRAVNCRLPSLQWALGPGCRPISIPARAEPGQGLPPLGVTLGLWAHVHIDGTPHATNAAVVDTICPKCSIMTVKLCFFNLYQRGCSQMILAYLIFSKHYLKKKQNQMKEVALQKDKT